MSRVWPPSIGQCSHTGPSAPLLRVRVRFHRTRTFLEPLYYLGRSSCAQERHPAAPTLSGIYHIPFLDGSAQNNTRRRSRPQQGRRPHQTPPCLRSPPLHPPLHAFLRPLCQPRIAVDFALNRVLTAAVSSEMKEVWGKNPKPRQIHTAHNHICIGHSLFFRDRERKSRCI